MSTEASVALPWYREPWPWLLALGPALVIVAGIVTTYLAVVTADGLVADDYYKRGLTINRELARDARAAALGLTALAHYDADNKQVIVTITGVDPASLDSMQLRIVHPARAAADRQVALMGGASGHFTAALDEPPQGPARLMLEGAGWRLVGQGALRREDVPLRSAIASRGARNDRSN
ncbi:MAG: FixH family protein [Burkholderiales bacterium]